MKTNDLEHVFFDLDHTLWDFDKNSELTFRTIFEKHHIMVNFDSFIESYKPINLKYWRLYRTNQISKEALRFNRLQEVFNSVGYAVSDETINSLVDDYIAYLSTFTNLFEGTIELLNYLKSKYTLHIITNGFTEGQTKKMKNSGLLPFFASVTDAEMVGVKKPNPIIFNKALQKANAKISNSIMIGDSYEADVMGAINMGLAAIFFNPEHLENPNKIKEVSALLQLKNYL